MDLKASRLEVRTTCESPRPFSHLAWMGHEFWFWQTIHSEHYGMLHRRLLDIGKSQPIAAKIEKIRCATSDLTRARAYL